MANTANCRVQKDMEAVGPAADIIGLYDRSSRQRVGDRIQFDGRVRVEGTGRYFTGQRV